MPAVKRGRDEPSPVRDVRGRPPPTRGAPGEWFPNAVADEWALPRDVSENLMSPALVVDLEKVRRNVETMRAALGGNLDRWRPHLKTTKIPIVWRELMVAGVRNFKVATTKEAEVLLETIEGFLRDGEARDDEEDAKRTEPEFDVLVAYPLIGPALRRLAQLAETFVRVAKVSALFESARELERDAGARFDEKRSVADALRRADVGFFLDVNPGMWRTGVGLDFCGRLSRVPRDDPKGSAVDANHRRHWRVHGSDGPDSNEGFRFRGFHYYEGHLSGCCDAIDGAVADARVAARARREESAALFRDHFAKIIHDILCEPFRDDPGRWERGDGMDACPFEVVTSGTPGFLAALDVDVEKALDAESARKTRDALEKKIETADTIHFVKITHRVSPGTVVFHDWRGERQNPDLGLVPAAALACRVVSAPRYDRRPGAGLAEPNNEGSRAFFFTLDCGSKSIAAEAGDPAGYVLGHPSWEALGPSEEHLPFACHDPGDKPRVGDLAFVVPEHVCPTVNLATHAVVLDRGEDGERVVSVHEVKARGHELFVGASGHELFVNRG